MNSEEWHSEEFYMGILLVCGPDPEPDKENITEVYRKWQKGVEKYVNLHGIVDIQFDPWMSKYYSWLCDRKLGWCGAKGRHNE